MKILSFKKLTALFALASTLSVRATAVATQTYEFQWQTADATFTPTYIWVTTTLNSFTAASTSILNYQITTPDGVWTPAGLTGTPDNTLAPFISGGTVEVINGGQNILFRSNAVFNANATSVRSISSVGPIGVYNVSLGAAYVSDTTYTASQPLSVLGAVGIWVAVPAVSNVPEITNSLVLLSAMFGIILVGYHHQLRWVKL